MKRNINMRTVFWCSTIFLFAFNIIGILLFKDNIRTSANTIVASLFFLGTMIRGVLALITKDQRIFYVTHRIRSRYFRYNRPTQKELRDLYFTATVYFAVIPFYLPLAAFSSKNVHTLWCILLYCIPCFVMIGFLIPALVAVAKQKKLERALLQMEKAEQEKREELGRWK